GVLEKTTVYEPGQIRIDESDDRIVEGATFEEAYDEIRTAAGAGPTTNPTVDTWEVLGDDVPCQGPIGSVGCLHRRRPRTQGGTAAKEFLFARGVGKVKETPIGMGSQLEELVSCSDG